MFRRTLLLFAILSFLSAPSSVIAAERLSLRSIYRQRIAFPKTGDLPYAQFDATGEMIHLIEPGQSRVRVIDWRKGQEVLARQYSGIPCADPTPGMRAIREWEPLSTGLIFMRYCGSFYFLDSHTLDVKYKLEKGEEGFVGVAFSPNGKHMAVVVADANWENRRIRVYELDTLTRIAEWPVTHWAEFPTFTLDGKYLVSKVVELKPHTPDQGVLERKACRVLSWRTDTWELATQKDYDPSASPKGGGYARDCPGTIYAIPGRIDAFLDASFEQLRIRNLRTGEVERTIRADRVLVRTAISHSGRWVAAGVHNDLFETPEYAQDFSIWDLQTGKLVYQPKKIPWFSLPRASYFTLSWSPDDRYLLVTRFEEITVCQIE